MRFTAAILLGLLILAGCGGGGGGGGSAGAAAPPRFIRPVTGAAASTPAAPASVQRWVTSAADSGAGTLRETLAAAANGDTIAVAAALAGRTSRVLSTLSVTKSVTITAATAPGFRLDGGGTVRVMQTAKFADVTLVGLTIANGNAPAGGAGGGVNALQEGRITVRHCTFTGNAADIGGALRIGYDTDATIEDCTFTGNDGARAANGFSAGAISTNGHGELIVRRSRFENNRGHSGGAIYNLLQPVTIEDCVFVGNSAGNNGGAFFTDEGNIVGPAATVGGWIRIRRCWIEGNQAYGQGGGLFLWANELDEVLVEDCVLFANRVLRRNGTGDAKGGAIRTRGICTIRRTACLENLAEQQGGGLWLDGDGPIRIENCMLTGNRVTADAGGAITFNIPDICTTAVVHCTIAGNHAGRACGAFWLPRATAPVTLTGCVVAGNTAGTDPKQHQVGYAPIDGGGNVEWPAPVSGGRRVAAGGLLADPLLAAVVQDGDMLVQPLRTGSPAEDRASPAGAPAADARGADRDDGAPDSGAWERTPGDAAFKAAPIANG